MEHNATTLFINKKTVDVDKEVQLDNFLFSTGVIVLSVVSEFIYGYTVNILAYISDKEMKLSLVNFTIYMTILLYVVSPYINCEF